MFAAAVLICSVSAGVCVKVDDEEGPFATRAECVSRIAEHMIPTGGAYLEQNGIAGPYSILSATCTKVEGEDA